MYEFKELYTIDFSNVKYISEFAFFGTNFTEITLNNISLIENFAFANIDSLTKVIIGENIKLMYYQIFNNCKNLKYLEILGKDIELHETKTFEGISPEIITICDLKVLRALVKYMENIKIVYFEENLITIDEIKDITSLDFIKASSDKAGFDMFIINKGYRIIF